MFHTCTPEVQRQNTTYLIEAGLVRVGVCAHQRTGKTQLQLVCNGHVAAAEVQAQTVNVPVVLVDVMLENFHNPHG